MTNSNQMTCAVCANNLDLLKSTKISYPLESGKKYPAHCFNTIHFCPNCGVGISIPVMTAAQLDSLYEDGDYWQDRKLKVFEPARYPGAWSNAVARFEFVKKLLALPKGASVSVLDIGGGHGFFGMAIAKDKDLHLSAYTIVEKDKFFQESLKLTWKELHPEVNFSVCSDVSEITNEYQLIVLSHVLEHVNDPGQMLKIAYGKLAAGGHVLTDVPYQDFQFKKDVFPHVLFFKPENLSSLFESAGLKPVKIASFGISQSEAKDRWVSGGYAIFFERLLNRSKSFLPLPISKYFYDILFKPGISSPKGIWIRALAKKPI